MEDKKRDLAQRWSRVTKDHRFAITAFWVALVCPLGMYSTPRFLASTVSFNDGFDKHVLASGKSPKQVHLTQRGQQELTFTLLLEQEATNATNATLIDGSSLLHNSTRDYTLGIPARVHGCLQLKLSSEDAGHIQSAPSPLTDIDISSYYTLEQDGVNHMGRRVFTRDGGRATVVLVTTVVSTNVPNGSKMVEDAVHNAIQDQVPAGVSIYSVSLGQLEDDLAMAIQDDFAFTHNVTAPMALFILLSILGSIKMLLIPALALISSLFGSIVVLLPIAQVFQISQFSPVVMGALAVALSIDYSLFMLSRFKEGINSGTSADVAIFVMVKSSGHNILVSCLVLCGSCLGSAVLPHEMLQTIGLCLSTVAFMCVVVNLSLVPALLHIMSQNNYNLLQWKGTTHTCLNWKTCTNDEKYATQVDRASDTEDDSECEESGISGSSSRSATAALRHNVEQEGVIDVDLWFRLGRILVHPKCGKLVLITIAFFLLPVFPFLNHFKLGFSAGLSYPSHSDSITTLNRLGNKFGFGWMYRTELWFEAESTIASVNDEDLFMTIQSALLQLTGSEFPATPSLSSYAGITIAGGRKIPFSRYQAALECGTGCRQESMRTIATLSDLFVQPGNHSTFVVATPEVPPTSSEGIEWVNSVRKKLKLLKDEGMMEGIRYYVVADATMIHDVMTSNIRAIPRFVGLSLVAVLILMGISFQSLVIPVLSLLSVVLTQGFVYGAAILVYEFGVLDFLGMPSLSSMGNLHWVPPLLSFVLVLGLGLDYDTFFIGRVIEYRKMGYTHDSSIVLALCNTRKVITAAGVIMTVSFCGFFHSDIPSANQYGFIMVVSVLMDTFVVRTTIFPILLHLFGEATYYPQQFGAPTKTVISGKVESVTKVLNVDEESAELLS